MGSTEHRNSLQPGYQLHWYHIERIIGQGGFGITYLARDTNLNQLVAIKEYLPVELAVREDNTSIYPVSGEFGEQYTWGLERFISEAQTLAKFKHPNIIRVLTVFRENNTAYMVMEYEQGRGLHEILKEKKTLDEETLKNIVLPILDGLEEVHTSDFIHRDIKPPNIYIREDSTPVLLDFGSARQSLSEQTRTLTTLVSPGYAPFEQYVSKSKKQGPWTDIYGLGATMYRSVTGVSPPDSMNRSEAILHTGKDIFVSATEIASEKYSKSFLGAIDHAMSFKPEDRPQSITEWRAEILCERDTLSGNKNNAALLSEPATCSELPTQDVNVDIEDGKNIGKTIKIQESEKRSFEKYVDATYSLVKRLLKWGIVLLLILIVLAILGKNKKHETDRGLPEQAPMASSDNEPATKRNEDIVQQQKPVKSNVTASGNEQLIDDLLANAQDDIKALRLTSPIGNNALEKYQHVLSLDPENNTAKDGINNIVSEYIRLMDNAIAEKQFDQAGKYLNKAIQINPDHDQIGPAQQRLTDAKLSTATDRTIASSRVPEKLKDEISSLRERIRNNPGDMQARRQLRIFANKYETNIKQAIKDGDYDLAREYVYAIQSISEKNSPAYRRLDELLKVIDSKSKSTP